MLYKLDKRLNCWLTDRCQTEGFGLTSKIELFLNGKETEFLFEKKSRFRSAETKRTLATCANSKLSSVRIQRYSGLLETQWLDY